MTDLPLAVRIHQYLATLAPHVRERDAAVLLAEAEEELNRISEREFVEQARAAIMGGWIPVSERVPDEGQECIAYAGENSFAARTILVPIWCGGFWHVSNGREYSKSELRHWMPLPGPPEEA